MSAIGARAQAATLFSPRIWRTLGVVGGLLMDSAWLAAWLHLLVPAAQHSPGLLAAWLMLIGGSAFALARASNHLLLRSWIHQTLAVAGLVGWFLASVDLLEPPLVFPDLVGAAGQTLRSLAELLPVPHEILIFIAVLWVWRRGTILAGSPDLNVGREGFRFRLGVLLFGIYVAVRGGLNDFQIPELLPTFFLASMVAMAAARVNSLSHHPASALAAFDLRWMAALMAILVLTTVLGLGVGWLFGSPPARQLVAALGVLVGAVLSALFALALPLFLLLTPLVQALIDWLQGLFAGLGNVLARVQINQAVDAAPKGTTTAATPGWMQWLAQAWPTFQWILIGAAAIALVFLITRSRQRRTDRGLTDLEGAEDLLPSKNPLGSLRQRVLNAQQGLSAWMRALRSSPWLSAWIIRRIYARMLAKADQDGRAKAPGETPREFAGALAGIYPRRKLQVADITRAYELVRYGLRPEDPAMVAQVQKAWAELQRSSP